MGRGSDLLTIGHPFIRNNLKIAIRDRSDKKYFPQFVLKNRNIFLWISVKGTYERIFG